VPDRNDGLAMWTLALHLALFAAPEDVVPTVAHWELDGSLVSAVGGEALVVEPATGATFVPSTFADDPSTPTQVLQLAKGAKVHVPIAFTLRGPGYEGRWTVVMDIQIGDPPPSPVLGKRSPPLKKPTWRTVPLVQTDPWNDDDAELLIDRIKGLDVAGEHGGTLLDGTWHRVAMVVDETSKTVTGFVDGVMVRRTKTDIADSRWALEPELLLFADEKREHPGVRLASLQVRTGAMAEAHIQQLGAPKAAGLPRPEAPLVAWSAPPPAALRPGQPFVATFRVSPPSGEVELVLLGLLGGNPTADVVLAKVPCDAGQVHGALPPGLVPGKHQLALRWVGDNTRAAIAPLEVLAGVSGDTALLGKELLQNPSFDKVLEPWVLAGSAVVEASPGANGTAVVGRRGDYSVRQVIALPPGLQGGGFAVTASARAKRKDRATSFGDRGTLVVRYLAANGDVLGSLRSMSVDKSEWHELAVRGPVPAKAERLEVIFSALERQGGKNEVALDQVAVSLQPLATEPVRLAKLPVLMPGQGLDEQYLVFETDTTDVAPTVVWGPVNTEAGDANAGPEVRLTAIESTTIDARHQVHRAVLTPLARGVAYRYRIELEGESSPTWAFTAAKPDDAPLTIAWLSDNQHGWRTFRQLVPQFAEAAPDFVVMTGDIVQRGSELREWQTEWFSPLSIGNFAQTTPVVVARGNHDGDGALAHAYVPLPGNDHWYAFTRAGVRFIVLDTEAEAGRVPEQVSWLTAELGGSDSKAAAFRIVAFHKAPYSNRWDSAKSKYDGEKWVRDDLVPLFETGQVDLVIAGHAHTYQRMDREGVRYLVIGGAGGRLDRYKTGSWPMDKDFVGHHWALMHIAQTPKGRQITWTAKDFDGKVIDNWDLVERRKTAR